jgi:peptidoglycan/xylan/chitin deacetylase (PgdA/CDA1 family)
MLCYKRKLAAFCSRHEKITALLGLLPARPVLLVLSYHRIGNASETPYDPGVFSATADGLNDQVGFLKRWFHLATLDEALEIIEGRALRHTVVLLTFDDGYRDSYELAYPILSAHRAQGVFFLPTAFIGTNHVPLWDSAAYIVKRSRRRRFRIPKAPLREFDLDADGASRVIQQALAVYKTGPQDDAAGFLEMLEEACDARRPDGPERVFLNWEEAAALLRGGMAIGSHTHTHSVLAQMSAEELACDLALSRRTIEERLGAAPSALAYSFGLREATSPAVFRAAEQAQFRAAFSFYEFTGCNLPGSIERFNVRRRPVSPEEASIFRLRTALAALTAGR